MKNKQPDGRLELLGDSFHLSKMKRCHHRGDCLDAAALYLSRD
jgi:hypothetical protein